MTDNEISLLLKDLCSRLPYGIKCQFQRDEYTDNGILRGIEEVVDENGHLLNFVQTMSGPCCQYYLSNTRPYLFPLSSMTDKQEKELYKVYSDEASLITEYLKSDISSNVHNHRFNHHLSLDWYLKNHFDINGLIEKGLAIDATDKNIY